MSIDTSVTKTSSDEKARINANIDVDALYQQIVILPREEIFELIKASKDVEKKLTHIVSAKYHVLALLNIYAKFTIDPSIKYVMDCFVDRCNKEESNFEEGSVLLESIASTCDLGASIWARDLLNVLSMVDLDSKTTEYVYIVAKGHYMMMLAALDEQFGVCFAATPRKFDEVGYLSANLDVKYAIEQGTFSSASSHFHSWGIQERRSVKMRISRDLCREPSLANEYR